MASIAYRMFNRNFARIATTGMRQNLCIAAAAAVARSNSGIRNFNTEKPKEQDRAAANNAETTEQLPFTEETFKKLQTDLAALTQELQSEKLKGSELLDKYRRSLADAENLRVRLNKQISDAKIYGVQSLCKDLLEVADILGQATKSVPQDELNEQNPHLKNLYQGLTMTQASLLQVFRRHGLVPVDPINEKFDPNMHEALFQKEDKSVEPDTIVEVTKLGYKLHDRCIRPALVGVSKG